MVVSVSTAIEIIGVCDSGRDILEVDDDAFLVKSFFKYAGNRKRG